MIGFQIKPFAPRSIPLLSEIPDPPEQLYIRGALPRNESGADAKFLCIVGARKYTMYGKQACEKLIGGLAGYNIVVVSGLALGIDGIAHRAALSAGLKTIAIPGSGLSDSVLYPRTHVGLAHEILKSGGALISEFDPGFRARPESFPQRNRLMAGMSHAVLVIEATERSGTLITARLAVEYNRDVCAMPGSIFSENAAGPHALIKAGATPVTSSDDLLEALGIDSQTQDDKEKHSHLSEEEREVCKILAEPKTKDELLDALLYETKDANILLSKMELKGLIKESGGKMYLA